MTAQHTPGPWHIVPELEFRAGDIRAADGTYLYQRLSSATDADARLIAEAPAMVEALRKAERFLAGFEGDTKLLDDPIDEDLAAIRAILARIDGGAA